MTDRDPDNLDEFENTGNDTSIPNGSGNPTFQEQQDIYNRQRAGYGEDGRNSYGYDSEGLDQDQRERIDRDNPDDADARETARKEEVKQNRRSSEERSKEERRSEIDRKRQEAEEERHHGRMMGAGVMAAGALNTVMGSVLDTIPNVMKLANGFLSGTPLGMTDAILGSVFNSLGSIQDNVRMPGGFQWAVKDGADVMKLSETPYGREYLKASQSAKNGTKKALEGLDGIYKDLNDRRDRDGNVAPRTGGAGMWNESDMDRSTLQDYYNRVVDRMAEIDDDLVGSKGKDRYELLAEKSVYMETLNKIQERAKDIDTTLRKQARDLHRQKVNIGSAIAEMNRREYEANKKYGEQRNEYYTKNPNPVISQIAATLNVDKAEEIATNGLHFDADGTALIHPSQIHAVYWPQVEQALMAAINNPNLTQDQRESAQRSYDYFHSRVKVYRTDPEKDAEALGRSSILQRTMADVMGMKGLSQLGSVEVDSWGYPLERMTAPNGNTLYSEVYSRLSNPEKAPGESQEDYNARRLTANHMDRTTYIDNLIESGRIDMNDPNNVAMVDRFRSTNSIKDETAKDIASYLAIMDVARVNNLDLPNDMMHPPNISTFSERVTADQINRTNWRMVDGVTRELDLDRTKAGQEIHQAFKEIDRRFHNAEPDVRNAIKVRWLEENEPGMDVYVKGSNGKKGVGMPLGEYLEKYHFGTFDMGNFSEFKGDIGSKVNAIVKSGGETELNDWVEKVKGLAKDVDRDPDESVIKLLKMDNSYLKILKNELRRINKTGELEILKRNLESMITRSGWKEKVASETASVQKKSIYLPFNRTYARKVEKVPDMPPSDRIPDNPYTVAEPFRLGFDESRASRAAVTDAYKKFCRMAGLDHRYKDSFDLFMSLDDDGMRRLVKDVNDANRILNVRDHTPSGFWYTSGLGKRDRRDPEYVRWLDSYRNPQLAVEPQGPPSMDDYRSYATSDPRATPSAELMNNPDSQSMFDRYMGLISTRGALKMMEDLGSDYTDSFHRGLRAEFAEGLENAASMSGMTPQDYVRSKIIGSLQGLVNDMRNNVSREAYMYYDNSKGTWTAEKQDADVKGMQNEAYLADRVSFLLKNSNDMSLGDLIKAFDDLKVGDAGKGFRDAFTRYSRSSKNAKSLMSEYLNYRDMAKVYNRAVDDHNHSINFNKVKTFVIPENTSPKVRSLIEEMDPENLSDRDLKRLKNWKVGVEERAAEGYEGTTPKSHIDLTPSPRGSLYANFDYNEYKKQKEREERGIGTGDSTDDERPSPGKKGRTASQKAADKERRDQKNAEERKWYEANKDRADLTPEEKERVKSGYKKFGKETLKKVKEQSKKDLKEFQNTNKVDKEEYRKARAEQDQILNKRRKKNANAELVDTSSQPEEPVEDPSPQDLRIP